MKRFDRGLKVIIKAVPASVNAKYIGKKGTITKIDGATIQITFRDKQVWYFRRAHLNHLPSLKRPAKRNLILTNLKNNGINK